MQHRIKERRYRKIQRRPWGKTGDNISPKLLTAALESIFKNIQWQELGINMRFADDIVLIADNIGDTFT